MCINALKLNSNQMKRNSILRLLVLLSVVISSCTSPKDITLFQPSFNEGRSFLKPPVPPEHKIEPFDNLYVKVLTLDSEVNKLFNPSTSSESTVSSTDQMYGSPVGQYLNGYRVNSEGKISLPIMGEIDIKGLTLKETEEKIKIKAQEYLKDPIIQVKLLNFKIDVLGEVTSPGLYYNFEGSINIIEAIGMANGVTKFANLRKAVVNRQENNVTTSYQIDLTQNDIYKSNVFYLRPNDVIYIPPSKLAMKQENLSTYSLVLSTLTSLLVIVTFFGIQP